MYAVPTPHIYARSLAGGYGISMYAHHNTTTHGRQPDPTAHADCRRGQGKANWVRGPRGRSPAQPSPAPRHSLLVVDRQPCVEESDSPPQGTE